MYVGDFTEAIYFHLITKKVRVSILNGFSVSTVIKFGISQTQLYDPYPDLACYSLEAKSSLLLVFVNKVSL